MNPGSFLRDHLLLLTTTGLSSFFSPFSHWKKSLVYLSLGGLRGLRPFPVLSDIFVELVNIFGGLKTA